MNRGADSERFSASRDHVVRSRGGDGNTELPAHCHKTDACNQDFQTVHCKRNPAICHGEDCPGKHRVGEGSFPAYAGAVISAIPARARRIQAAAFQPLPALILHAILAAAREYGALRSAVPNLQSLASRSLTEPKKNITRTRVFSSAGREAKEQI